MTVAQLRECVELDPSSPSGLRWLARTPEQFTEGRQSALHKCRSWNARFAGKPTGSGGGNYHHIGVALPGQAHRFYKAHRCVYALAHGVWPSEQIDHIDGNPGNNAVENLRDVPNSINSRNQCRRSTNTSGVVGVSWCKRRGKWQAYAGADGRRVHFGYFTTTEEAATARLAFFAANPQLGFTQRHIMGVAV